MAQAEVYTRLREEDGEVILQRSYNSEVNKSDIVAQYQEQLLEAQEELIRLNRLIPYLQNKITQIEAL